jgi:Domain of unknown function (DUF5666)
MQRKSIVVGLVIFLMAFGAAAQMRMHPSAPPASNDGGMGMGPGGVMPGGQMPLAMISGKVEAIGTSSLTLVGAILVDASAAKIVADGGAAATLASVKIGDVVFVILKSSDVTTNGPLPATAIVVNRSADLTMTGDVQSVDAANKTFTLLGRTIYTDANTSYGGMGPAGTNTFANIQPDGDVSVTAKVVSGRIVASSVMVMSPIQIRTTFLRGTVKSIAADKWVITTTTDVTVLVNTQTKIVGAPKVGDKVDVIATTDSAKNYVALSIMKSIF